MIFIIKANQIISRFFFHFENVSEHIMILGIDKKGFFKN